jgi:signal transduction histidine kinase
MPTGVDPGYGDHVTSNRATVDSERPALHVLAGVALAVVSGAVLGLLFILWAAALWSLVTGPTGAWYLDVLYVLMVLVGPIALLWCVWEFAAVHRARFPRWLGAEVAEPARPNWGPVLVRPWRSGDTWRQLGYHALALVLTPAAIISLLAGPRGARTAARVDGVLAHRLLGPSRAEELARRAQALAERVDSLTRSRAEIVAATDSERRRIERDLHDGAQQRLVHLAMNLGMALESGADLPEPGRRVIEQAHAELTVALAELRDFIRGLHPAVINDRGLDAALSGIVATAAVPVRLRVDVSPRCSATIEAIAYFTVSEALTNVAKHAEARHADVTVDRDGDTLRIVVTDDGRGGASLDGAGSGLRGLRQRVEAVDGTLTVHSPLGGPTIISAELPCES